MSEILLIMINFIVIMVLIKLGISKYSKYKINKLTFNQRWKNRQIEYNDVVIGLNLMFLPLVYLESNSLVIMISTFAIAIIDIITVIRMGAFSRFKNNLNK